MGRRRFPAPGLARYVHAQDRTCRFPGCRKPARFCDLDHVRPYAEGGETVEGNLIAACRRHHRAKHEGGWTVTRAADGVVTWTGPTGRAYRTVPEPWEDLDRPPPATASTPPANHIHRDRNHSTGLHMVRSATRPASAKLSILRLSSC
ncbi:HNH endonuclease signature motif containing protein [Protofrankia symbiont of Coriaria ruscifolia]|uniref:HNH endonuclease signature motif containing protein n=1 Tax=Protofrankia symbiont of Coriaria ruscifolia TaxID=1306542 RepID=UPI0013EF6957